MDNFDPEQIPGWSDDTPRAAESVNATDGGITVTAPAGEPDGAVRPDEPASPPEPTSDVDELDRLLAEFDRSQAAQQPEMPAPDPIPDATVDAFNKATADADAARQGYDRRAFLLEQDRQFDSWTAEWQDKMPPWSEPEAFREKALLAAMQDPELLNAFRALHVHKINPADAVREHNQILSLARAGLIPAAQEADARARLAFLATAARAQQMLLSAANRIRSNAWKYRPPDADATSVKAMVSEAVLRGASTSTPPAEPAPDFNSMSDQELRRFTQKEYGFSSI